MKLYIGISGKMGTGKSTLTAGLMHELSSLRSERVSMAAPIYNLQNMIYDELGMTVDGDKDRPLLIALGMWGRDRSSDFWLKQAVRKFEESDAELIICDDVRFENEAKWFEENGILIRLEGEQRGDNVDASRADNITETALDGYAFKNIVSNTQGKENTLLSALHLIGLELGVNRGIAEELVQQAMEG